VSPGSARPIAAESDSAEESHATVRGTWVPLALMVASIGCGCASQGNASSHVVPSVRSERGVDPKRAPRALSLAEVAERVRRADGLTYVFDANSLEMYQHRHVPGARWVDYAKVTRDVLPADQNAMLVFYCAGPQCSASPTAAQTAIDLGWRNVHLMPEGIFGWVKAGLPVEGSGAATESTPVATTPGGS